MAEFQLAAGAPLYQCKSCERDKVADDFYVSNQTKCKECVKASVRANRAEKAEYYRAYDRKRYRDNPKRKEHCLAQGRSPQYAAKRAEALARSRREEPQKHAARNAVSNAIRDGKIERGTACFFCGGDKRLQAHHEDYDHPLDVVWLCASCHGKLHAIKGDFRRAS